jgi:NAD-dependent deacetylase
VIIFSGAGISAESGIRTFRDYDGLWEEFNIEEICQKGCLEKNREKVIQFYDNLRTELKDKHPNKAHLKIKELQDKYPEIKIITQNVDDLFEKAGCADVLHLHGFLREIYCENCNFSEDIGYSKQTDKYKLCPKCNKNTLRPNIVFFNEFAPKYAELYNELQNCEFLAVIGTSGFVINTDDFITKKIKYSILNILTPSPAFNEKLYSKVIYKKATEAIDEIAFEIAKFISVL